MVTIPANSRGPICVSIMTINDTDSEEDETFTVSVTNATSPKPASTANPRSPIIGRMNTTTVTIIGMMAMRTCMLSGDTGNLLTFGSRQTYRYNKTCEHSLITQRTSFGDFAIVVESLDGTYGTTRVGVSLGRERLVVKASNATIIRSENLLYITTSSTRGVLVISVSVLGVLIEVSSLGIDISLSMNSVLTPRLGLCGNRNGVFLFRNGSTVDVSNSYILNKAIAQYLTPPSETFVRMVTRRQCGK